MVFLGRTAFHSHTPLSDRIMRKSFSDTYTLEQRQKMACEQRAKYTDRTPIIVERAHTEQRLPRLDKERFIVPIDLTMGQLEHVIRRRLQLTPTTAIFISTRNNVMIPNTEPISRIDDQFQDPDDGFVYLTYRGEETFGNSERSSCSCS